MRLMANFGMLVSICLLPASLGLLTEHAPPPPSGCFWNPESNSVICTGGVGGGASGSVGGTSGSSGSAPGGQAPQVYLEIGSLQAATASHPICWVPAEDDVTGDTPTMISQIKQFWSVVETVFPPCPGVAATTAFQWAFEYWTAFWYTKQLPRPHPLVPPGYAITGLPAYLVCGDGDLVTVARPTPLGELIITARATYDVDWGDGARSTAATGPCTAWPDGTVEHTYDETGTYAISVDEDWHVTWTLGHDSGTFQDVITSGTLQRLEVRQVQGVVTG